MASCRTRRAVLALTLATGCSARESAPAVPKVDAQRTDATPTSDVEELHAFAKLYGYVRFFHPSDEAAAADWDRVAVEGAAVVVQGDTRAELLAHLREIFEPLAPTLLVFPADRPPPAAAPARDGPVLAWQHEGFGFGQMASAYFSARTGRPRQVWAEGSSWAPISRSIPAASVRGKRLRLRGWARVDGTDREGKAQLWLRIDGADARMEFFQNMQERPIVATSWQEAAVESPPVGPRATAIAFGGIATGDGAAFFDDFVLEAAAPDSTAWTPIALDNPGFESSEVVAGWEFASTSYSAAGVPDAHGGRAALKIERKGAVVDGDLFAERPRVGETFERDLGANLRCRVVLGLPASEPKRVESTAVVQLPTAEDPSVRAAAVISAWNVLRHFYPYHDVIAEDWEAVLDPALTDVLDDRGPADLRLTLLRLVHRLHDGHGWVNTPLAPEGHLQLRIARVEGTFIVLAAPEGHPVRRGDELASIDGVAMDRLFEQRAQLVSGSPQWTENVLLTRGHIAMGPMGSRARVELRRDGAPRTVEVERRAGDAPEEWTRPTFSRLERGVLYVDLVHIPQADLMKRIGEIARAPAVVVDVRGYPQSDPVWLGHFLSAPERTKWMFVPHVIRPDYEGVTTFSEHGWDLDPLQPHVGGKVAFLTGSGAISYAESLMGYVEGHRLGAIVGSATAGANGNVNPFALPGGFGIVFTGMKVTRMDGRQHHVVGVQPTHPVVRTLAGIRAGRDEELEAAVAIVRPTKGERR